MCSRRKEGPYLRAREGGYEIEINPRTGAPEIAGFSAEYLAENSKRRQEVLRNEARLKAEARERGIAVDDASLRSEAARMDRKSKKFDREEMQARHIELDAKYGYTARNAVDRALARDRTMQQENPALIRESVNYGIEHALEREAVVKRAEIEAHALWRGQYRVTYEQIKAEIDGRIKTGELIEIDPGDGPEMTSRAMVELERNNIARMRGGQGTQLRIAHPNDVDARINDAAEKNLGFHLLIVMDERGRLVEYDPERLKGVAVYREDERGFSVGDRIQFRAPYPAKRITTNEIAYVERIAGDRMTVRMDDEKRKQVTIDLSTYKHIDYGFATTSQGAQGLGAYRVIINANAYESAQLLNERMGYVANSRAERHVTIYTNSKADLPYALARTSGKETAIDALLTSEQRKELIQQQRAAETAQRQVRKINPDHGDYGTSR